MLFSRTVLHVCESCVAAIGACVFCASTSVGALFIYGGNEDEKEHHCCEHHHEEEHECHCGHNHEKEE